MTTAAAALQGAYRPLTGPPLALALVAVRHRSHPGRQRSVRGLPTHPAAGAWSLWEGPLCRPVGQAAPAAGLLTAHRGTRPHDQRPEG